MSQLKNLLHHSVGMPKVSLLSIISSAALLTDGAVLYSFLTATVVYRNSHHCGSVGG